MIENSNKYKRAFIAAIAGILIFFLSFLVPFLIVLYPLPFLVTGYKSEVQYGMLAALISAATVAIFAGPLSGLVIFSFSLMVFLPLLYTIKKNYTNTSCIFLSGLFILVLAIVTSVALGFRPGGEFGTLFKAEILKNIESQIQLVSPELSAKTGQTTSQLISRAFDYALANLAAIFFVASMLISLVNYYALFGVLRRQGYRNNIRFSDFYLPKYISDAVIASILAVVLISLFKLDFKNEFVSNITMVFSFLFSLQGISCLIKILGKKINKTIASVIVLLILITSMGSVFTIIGMLDHIFNLRKRL